MRPLPRFAPLTFGLLLTLLPMTCLWAADDEPDSASESERKTIKVSGVLEAVTSVEIMADTEQLDSLLVKRVAPHGKMVNQGESLVWFDHEALDRKIKDAETDRRLSELTMRGEAFDYEQFLKTQDLDKAAAERNRKAAQQDYDFFVEIDRERQIKSAEFNLKSARASLENAQEELKQLEQMYREDDLTEESEEIVIKRAKQAVESAQFRFDSTETQTERTLNQEIPRAAAEQEDALSRAELAFEKRVHELNLARQKRDIERSKETRKFDEQEKDLEELKQQRKQMVLTSPIEGIALHGKLTRGRLPEKPSSLEADTKVAPKQVLITVVDPKRLQVRVDLDEEHLATVKAGSSCKISIKAYPEWEAKGTVKSVSNVPYAATKYDCVVSIHAGKSPPQLLPTMTCELQFQSREPSDDDEMDDDDDDEKDQAETAAERKEADKE